MERDAEIVADILKERGSSGSETNNSMRKTEAPAFIPSSVNARPGEEDDFAIFDDRGEKEDSETESEQELEASKSKKKKKMRRPG